MTHSATMIAPAKINLALHITGQRTDGYHLMESLVVFADHGDTVTVEPAEHDEIIVSGHFAAHVPIGGDNLIARARDLLRAEFGPEAEASVRLHLEKNLPVASGIGGGSSDAAAALRLLASHWRLPLCEARLHELSLRLGADLPMCLAARPLLARGIGDDLEELPSFPALPMLLVNPGLPLSTAEVFANLQSRENAPLPPVKTAHDIRTTTDWLNETRNDLEHTATTLVPQIGDTLVALREAGALSVRMSGSGASCFGVFSSPYAARRAEEALAGMHPEWFVVATETRPAEASRAA